MTPIPAVRCLDCGFYWNSTTMADGLRLLGSCPKCSGALVFREGAQATDAPRGAPAAAGRASAVAPHLVLGLPRKDGLGF